MKHQIIFLCLCLSFLTPGVISSVTAGPYQMVFLWYAYQMSGAIAPNCKGTAPGGRCYFDEFLKDIQQTGKNVKPWTGSTNVGTNLEPGVESAAESIAESGYSCTQNPSALLPKNYPVKGQAPSYSDLYTNIVNEIQSARQTEGDAKLATQLGGAQQAMTATLQARLMDQDKAYIGGLNAKLKSMNAGFEVKTKTWTMLGGMQGLAIDTEATLDSNPNPDSKTKFLNAIMKYAATGFSNPSTPIGKTANQHALAIQATQDIQSRIFGSPSC